MDFLQFTEHAVHRLKSRCGGRVNYNQLQVLASIADTAGFTSFHVITNDKVRVIVRGKRCVTVWKEQKPKMHKNRRSSTANKKQALCRVKTVLNSIAKKKELLSVVGKI